MLLACGKAPPPPPEEGQPSVPVTAPPSAAPVTAAPVTTPPKPKPHATLFTGDQPAIPAVFEGLAPGMPQIAARVLFPQLPDDQIIKAPYDGLRLTVYITNEQVFRLGIETLGGLPAGAKLRELITARWSAGERTKDESGRVLTLWHAPQSGLRVTHQAEPDGNAHVFFDAFMPLSALAGVTMPTLRAQIGRTPAQAKQAFEGATLVDDGVAVPLPALAFGQPVTAHLLVGAGDAAKTIQRIEFDLSFVYKPAFKAEILKTFTGSFAQAKRDPSKVEAFTFKDGRIDAKADRWRVTLR